MAKFKMTPELAQEIVDFVASKTSLPMIVTDENGVIIGCTDKARIGVQHAVAQRIVRGEMDEFVVTAEDQVRDPKMRMGYNCLIGIEGERVGNMGIGGDPEVVKPLVRVAVSIAVYRIKEDMHKNLVTNVVHKLSDNVNQAAADIEEISASSEELAATTDKVVKISQTAASRVKQTGQILEMSRSIAVQTKLLGLNASIEAARAGIHGRGFSVVAGEMQKLAHNSAEATEKIKDILEEIQGAIQNVISGIDQTASVTGEQAQALQDIIGIVESVKDTAAELVESFDTKDESLKL